jgi:hypothetical protein
MKEMKAFMLAGGITLALSLGISAAIASDTAGATSDGPTAEQIKNSKSRGLIAVPLTPPSTIPAKNMINVTKPPVTHEVTTTQPAKKSPVAVTKPPVPVRAATIAKPSFHAPQTVAPHKQLHTSTASLPVHKTTTSSVHTTKSPIKTASTPTTAPAAVLASTDDSGSNVLKAWLNKADPHYKTGERMEINVSSDRDCNVVIFDFDGKGTLTQLFPNQYQPSGVLKSGETVTVGGQSSPFDYTANLLDGQQRSEERLFVYAYPTDKETPLSVAMNPAASTPFRSSKLTPAEYKKLVAHAPTFFQSQDRNVKITPKANVKIVSADSSQSPNKIELPVVIER